MARIIGKSEYLTHRLPNFSIESRDFAKILARIFGHDAEIQIELGSDDAEEHIVLEGMDDVENNISLLRSPLCVSVGEIKIGVGCFPNSIKYKEDQSTLVSAILADFNSHTPWYKFFILFLSNNLLAKISISAVPYVILNVAFYKNGIKDPEQYGGLLSVWFIAYLSLDYLISYFIKPKVLFRPLENFLHRNKDKFIWAVMAFIVTIALQKIVQHFGMKFP